MFGGYEFILEGAAVSSTLLFVIVLLGINYKQRLPGVVSWGTGDDSSETKTPEEETVTDIADDHDTLYDDGEVDYDDYDYDYEPYGDDYDYELEED